MTPTIKIDFFVSYRCTVGTGNPLVTCEIDRVKSSRGTTDPGISHPAYIGWPVEPVGFVPGQVIFQTTIGIFLNVRVG